MIALVFAEYQFLRYFIPGSLYVIYTSLLIIPNLAGYIVDHLVKNGDVLIGVFVGVFGASLAFGYVIYTFYDSLLYNFLAMRPGWRDILSLMESEMQACNVWTTKSNEEKKEFLDTLYYYLDKRDPMNQKFSETIRGIWSHFNARIVCLLFVPIFSGATVFLLWLIEQGGDLKLFYFRSFDLLGGQRTYLSLSAFIIIVISLVFLWGARRPYKEAVKLEHYFLKSKIEDSRTDFERLAKTLLGASFPNKNTKHEPPSKTKKKN